jgi:hypothetical protein
MSRLAIAIPVGILGMLLYVGLIVSLADWVHEAHWLLELAYFIAAGIAWVPPARALMLWAARAGS